MVRDATSGDSGSICNIYNYYISNTIITFEETPLEVEEMQHRIAAIQADGLPWLVHADNDAVIGYAYAGKWHARSAYRYTVESTVYLRHGAYGKGIGSELYRELIKRLQELDYHAVIGGIALPNPASVALHEKFGYVKAAHYTETGFKFGRWIDVGYWEKLLKEK